MANLHYISPPPSGIIHYHPAADLFESCFSKSLMVTTLVIPHQRLPFQCDSSGRLTNSIETPEESQKSISQTKSGGVVAGGTSDLDLGRGRGGVGRPNFPPNTFCFSMFFLFFFWNNFQTSKFFIFFIAAVLLLTEMGLSKRHR